MGFIKPNNNSGGSGGGLTPQELSRLNNAYTHSKSEHAPTTAEQNVQPDWNETDTTSDAYIKNKPDLSQIGSGGNIPSVTQIEPQELDMPKVFFYGNALPATKDNVNLTMDYISNTAKFSSFVKLKCQGTSSMSYAKKNFTVSMYSDEARATKLKKDFKGWGAQSKFCLKANYVDTTHTRNISGARIAYDMVQSRPDSTFKQQLLQCPRNGLVDGFPIKLYFNGEFYGIYTWNIPKDAWMFNMDKSNLNHIVLCAEKNTDGNSSAINSCQFRQLWTNGDGQDWSVEVGTMSEDLRTKFNRVIAFVMNATDQEFHDNIGEYFDLYSLLDYYCFSYFVNHLDGLAKNMLMVTYDGVIWGASLYDMDSIYGVSWNGGSFVSPQYQCPEQYQEQFSRLWVRIEQCFATELYARYLELRQGALSLSNIVKHVEEIYDVIPDRVFADEKAKWTSLPNVNNNTMTRFRNYMRDRAIYVDAQMQEIGTPQSSVECTGISLDKNTLALGVVAGGTTDDSNKNYLENVAWELGMLKTDGSGYLLADSANDYRCQLTDLPVGIYTLHHDTYKYKKVGINDNGVALLGTNVKDYNDTNDITFNITNPKSIVDISVFPNGVTPITGVTLTRTDIADIQEYTFDYNNATSPGWGSQIDNNYLLIEMVLGSSNDIDRNKLVTVSIGDDIYYISHTTTSNATSFNALLNKCNSVLYSGNVLIDVAVPKSKYGNTLDEFKAYCSNNGISNIYINKDIQSIGETLSAQLTATVTPDNCTQPVVWSVDPTGIVTVNNGLVTAVTNGEATVTATCGSQSATCAVTVSGMIEDTAIYATAEYAITEPRTFNGISDYIDTGIKLFDTAKTFTIFVDYVSNTPTPSSQATIFHCLHEEPPYRGLCLMEAQSSNDTYFIGGQVNTQANYISNMPSRGKYLISFVNGVINNIVTRNNSNELVYSATDMASNNPYVQISENLLIGCYQDTSGRKGRYWSGTINKFGVWYKQLTSDEINKVFGKNGGDSGGDTDTTLLYSLPEETVFNGTSTCIDTGVALLSTDQDFTITLDVTATNGQNNSQATIFHCMHEESPYHGLSLMTTMGDAGFYIPAGNNSSTIGQRPYLISPNIRTKVVIIKEGTTLSAYSTNNSTSSCNYTYTQVNENLLIGAYQTTSGVKGRYFLGTVHDFKIYNKAFTSQEKDAYLDISTGVDENPNSSRVFKIDSTCMNTTYNALIDSVAGIRATLTGNPTVSDNQIAFTASDAFSFDLSSLNLTSSNRTFRIKFTPTTLDNTLRNVIGIGVNNTDWVSMTPCYITNDKLILQHGSNNFTNVTVGIMNAGNSDNRLSVAPVTGQEYEIVISENTDGNVRWFIDGTLVQGGTSTLFNPLYLNNTEGTNRFIGSYSLIEIYNGYCNDYTEFTNMVNNA